MFSYKGVVASVVVASFVSDAFAQEAQRLLGYPSPVDQAINFTKLFSGDILSHQTWSKESWNGLTSFAKAIPLRCFGSDSGVDYDVAVIGEQFGQ